MKYSDEDYIKKNFTEIELDLNNLWLYQVRVNIFKVFQKNSLHFFGNVLDVGCGIMPYKKIILGNKAVSNYVGMDLEKPTYYKNVKPDCTWDGCHIPFENNSFECIIATEVLEHVALPDLFLKEVYRVLKPNGIFFCTVPFIWHLHEVPFDEYRYTPFSIKRLINQAGFKGVEVNPTGGWDSALSQMLGLWVTFRPMKRIYKTLFLRVVYFTIILLNKFDKSPEKFDNRENSMISGLYAICKK